MRLAVIVLVLVGWLASTTELARARHARNDDDTSERPAKTSKKKRTSKRGSKKSKKAQQRAKRNAKKAKHARGHASRRAKRRPADDELIVIEEPDRERIEGNTEDRPRTSNKRGRKQTARRDREPRKHKKLRRDLVVVIDDDEPETTSHDAAIDESLIRDVAPDEDETARPHDHRKTEARLDDDDDGDELDDESPVRVSKTSPRARPRPTRFYFRAGGFRQTSTLGDTQFALETDLPVDTSTLGANSGVVMEQKQIPVGVIVGYVLPVWNRRLSLETVLGFPSRARFQATGALANDSLAPTFMGMPTGIQALGPDLGEATFAPPMLTSVYRIADLGPVTPIAGAGVMVLLARNTQVTNPVLNAAGDPKLVISPSPGLVLQGGLEVKLWSRIAARLDVKYVLGMRVNARVEDIAVTPTAIPQLGTIEVGDAVMSSKVTPLVIQAGIGADF